MISCSSFFAFLFFFTLRAAVPASAAAFVRLLHPANARSRAVSMPATPHLSYLILPQLLHSRFERPGDLDCRHHVRQPPALHLADRCLPASHLSCQPPLAHAEVFSVFFHFVSHFVLSPYHKVSALCAFWPDISPFFSFFWTFTLLYGILHAAGRENSLPHRGQNMKRPCPAGERGVFSCPLTLSQ